MKRISFLEMPFRKAIKYYEDDVLYTMYRLCKMGKYKECAQFGFKHKHPLRNIQLKLIKFKSIDNLDMFDTAYVYVHGYIPKCVTCGTKLKHQMYSINMKKYCSKKCQEHDRYKWAKNRMNTRG